MAVIFIAHAYRRSTFKVLLKYIELLLEKNLIDYVFYVDKMIDRVSDARWFQEQRFLSPVIQYSEDEVYVECHEVVFIDVEKFKEFTDLASIYSRVVPSMINDSFSMMAQREFGLNEFTDEVICKLPASGVYGEFMHKLFYENYMDFIEKSRQIVGVEFDGGEDSVMWAYKTTSEKTTSFLHLGMVVSRFASPGQLIDGLDDVLWPTKYLMLVDKYKKLKVL